MILRPGGRVRRRQVLRLALGACAVAGPSRAAPARPTARDGRVVVLDWGLAATAVMLGARVSGVPATRYYDLSTVAPRLPDDVTDVGLLFTPNFELLDQMRPDLIVIAPGLTVARPFLERIAPVLEVDPADAAGTESVASAMRATLALGTGLGRAAEARRLIAQGEDRLAEARRRLADGAGRPVLLATQADDRHLALFGPASLLGDTLSRLGLTNAWQENGLWGGRSVVPLEGLAPFPEAAIVLLDAAGSNAVDQGLAGIFWQSLPAVRAGRVHKLPAVQEAGGLPAVLRLANLLVTDMAGGGGPG